jgi:hypothetical protein
MRPAVPAGCADEWAIVLIVSVTGEIPEPVIAAIVGVNAQLAPVGRPLVHARATEPVNPPTPETFRLNVADCPEFTVCDDPLAPLASAKSDAVPLKTTVSTSWEAGSLTINVPAGVPAAPGMNDT